MVEELKQRTGGRGPDACIDAAWPLSRAPEAYRMFNDKSDDCTKVVLDPAG